MAAPACSEHEEFRNSSAGAGSKPDMRIRSFIISWLAAGAAIASATSQSISLPLRLDLVPNNAPAHPTHVKLWPSDVYPGAVGYGWQIAAGVIGQTAPVGGANTVYPDHRDVLEADRKAVLRTMHQLNQATTRLLVDTGPGRFLVKVSIGRISLTSVTQDQDTEGTELFAESLDASSLVLDAVDLTDEVNPWTGVHGLWTRTLPGKASLATSTQAELLGAHRSIWFRYEVVPGATTLGVRFSRLSPDPVYCSHIEIYAEDAAPLTYDPISKTLSYNPAYASPAQAALQAGASALNDQHDVNAAFLPFDGISNDPLARACGLLWTAGWLDEGPSTAGASTAWTALDRAITELEAMAGGASGHAALWLDTAYEFRRALRHQRWRGYAVPIPMNGVATSNPYANEENSLLKNLNAAEAALRCVAGQRLSDIIGNPHRIVHPLLFKGFANLGINWLSRSAHNQFGNPGSPVQAFLKQHFDLWGEFDLAAFPKSSTLAIGKHVATFDGPDGGAEPDYDEDNVGGIVVNWNGEAIVANNRWWNSLLAEADAIPASTAWSNSQRRGWLAYRAAMQWWQDERLFEASGDPEFGDSWLLDAGGGLGDDVEFLGPMLFSALPLRGNEPDLDRSMRALTDSTLDEFDAVAFFTSTGTADVEHTAEYTGYPALIGLHQFFSAPYYLDFARRTMRHLDPDPTQQVHSHGGWTVVEAPPAGAVIHVHPDAGGVPTTIDHRRFRSFYFDGDSVLTGLIPNQTQGNTYYATGDTVWNGKALLTSYVLRQMSTDEAIRRPMREWAEYWWHVAMSEQGVAPGGSPGADQAKPMGVLPAVVRTVANGDLSFGDLGSEVWYDGLYDFVIALKQSNYIYSGLFLDRYRDPKTPANQRADYLLPIFFASRFAAELHRESAFASAPPLVALGTSNAPGTPRWVAEKMHQQPAFLGEILSSFRAMQSETQLLAAVNQLSGQPPITQNDIRRQLSYLRHLLIAKLPQAGLALAADPAEVAAGLTQLAESLEKLHTWNAGQFPYGTDFVAFTDRAFMSTDGAIQRLVQSMTGGGVRASTDMRLTLEPDPAQMLLDPVAARIDVTSLVESFDAETPKLVARIGQYETGSGSVTVRARLWFGYSPGTYEVNFVPAGGSAQIWSTQILRPGHVLSLQVPRAMTAGEISSLTVERVGPPTADPEAYSDLGIGSADLRLEFDGSGLARITNRAYNLGPLASSQQSAFIYIQIETAPGVFTPLQHVASVVVPSLAGTTGLDVVSSSFASQWFNAPSGVRVRITMAVIQPADDGYPDNFVATKTFTLP